MELLEASNGISFHSRSISSGVDCHFFLLLEEPPGEDDTDLEAFLLFVEDEDEDDTAGAARAVVVFLGGGEGLVFRFLGGAEDEAATRGLFPDFDLAGGEDLCSH